jgi:hypothetical protein
MPQVVAPDSKSLSVNGFAAAAGNPNSKPGREARRRFFFAGARSQDITIVEPNTLFEDRWTQIDLRFGRPVRIDRVTISPRFGIYNGTNTNAVVGAVSAYSEFVPTLWRRPFEIFTARLFKFGVSVDW